ncbi:MAG: type II toxin-antitoxin system VapC family toxin [Betaproteobacteria bacterium]|nr:type II toxin-antitoxin system VapC family toxin [Betaproteobacteria bacterium]
MSHLLDTCVISELVKPEPNEAVLRWLSEQDEGRLFLSVLTMGELERGIAKLTASRKKASLGKWVRRELARRFEDRILPIDLPVAQHWGMIAGSSERTGQPLPVIDSLISATAMAHGFIVVSRNEADFKRCGAECVNPWRAS